MTGVPEWALLVIAAIALLGCAACLWFVVRDRSGW